MTPQSTIRRATSEDLPEIERLLAAARLRGLHQQVPRRELGAQQMLVLDSPDGDGLAAVVMVVVRGSRGHVEMLVVDERFAHLGIEERMLGVCEALCTALGATHVDIASARAHDTVR